MLRRLKYLIVSHFYKPYLIIESLGYGQSNVALSIIRFYNTIRSIVKKEYVIEKDNVT